MDSCKLSEFCQITGSSENTAQDFLKQAEWDLHLAVTNFFKVNNTVDINTMNPQTTTKTTTTTSEQSISDNSLSIRDQRPINDNDRISNITVNTGDKNKDDTNHKEPEAYYAGGSVSSGQQILSGPMSSDNDGSVIMNMFNTIRRSTFAMYDPSSSFYGQGYRLGHGNEETNRPQQQPQQQQQQQQPIQTGNQNQSTRKIVDMVLRVWRNGFTIDDGPLRNVDNPKDKELLQIITNGLIPQELLPTDGSSIQLKVEDHSNELHTRQRRLQKPFTGKGNRLGSTLDAKPQQTTNNDKNITNNNKNKNDGDTIKETIPVDKNKPFTTIQVRMNDGRRLKIILNHNHTIGDLRNSIITLEPQLSDGNFRISTSYPNVELIDDSVTIEQAGIINSSLILRKKK